MSKTFTKPLTSGDGIYGAIHHGNRLVAIAEGNTPEEQQERARRIVACVNACTGVDTETLESKASELREWHEETRLNQIAMAERNLELKDQRDELLLALKGLLSLHEPQGRFQPSHYKPFLFKAAAAIAKVDPGYSASQAYADVATAVEQRDDLLAALKRLREDAYNACADSSCNAAFELADAVIAKCEVQS